MIRPLIPEAALLIENEVKRTLVIADLHLGFEHELAEKGVNIPSQTPKIQLKLLQIIEEYKPDRLIFLGDVKHNVPQISMREWREVPQFFEVMERAVKEIQVIPGNHDGELKPLTSPAVKLESVKGILLGQKEKIGLFHGHTWPAPQLLEANYLIVGHIHPTIQIKDAMGFKTIRPVWIRAQCIERKLIGSFLRYKNIKPMGDPIKTLEERFNVSPHNPTFIIMPAFNDILGGLPINLRSLKDLIGPVLRSGSIKISLAEAYLLDGTFLGKIKDLRRLA